MIVHTAGELANVLRASQLQLEQRASHALESELGFLNKTLTFRRPEPFVKVLIEEFDALDPKMSAPEALETINAQLGWYTGQRRLKDAAQTLTFPAGIAGIASFSHGNLPLALISFLAGFGAVATDRYLGAPLAATKAVMEEAQALVHPPAAD